MGNRGYVWGNLWHASVPLGIGSLALTGSDATVVTVEPLCLHGGVGRVGLAMQAWGLKVSGVQTAEPR